jgi:HAD superfamily hydrolase (TIGR01490 family)
MRAALFDLDKTLLDCNSATLWLRHEWKAGRVGVRDVAWAVWALTQYHLGRDGLEKLFEEAAMTVNGLAEEVLVERTRLWFETDVAPRLRPGGKAAMERHRQQGDRIVLATSGTVYAARCAQKAYGFDEIICTTLHVEGGVLTGKLHSSAYGPNKLLRVQEWAEAAGIRLEDCTFYTDSFTDVALLEKVGTPVAVHPDRRLAALAQERRWAVEEWGYAG